MAWRGLIESLCVLNIDPGAEGFLHELNYKVPEVFWCPDSGPDVSPLALHVPNSDPRQRLLPPWTNWDRHGNLVLWMSDHRKEWWAGPTEFEGWWEAAHALMQLDLKTHLVGPVGRFAVRTAYRLNPRSSLFVPMDIFRVRIDGGGSDDATAVQATDHTVIFSPARWDVLLEHVFVPHRLKVHTVIVPYPWEPAGDLPSYHEIPQRVGEAHVAVGHTDTFFVDLEDDLEIPGYHRVGGLLHHGSRNRVRWVPDDPENG